jgi:5-methylcytosine-specific restriction endonuclease McrA
MTDIPLAVRQAVLDRDGAQCQGCGTAGENRLTLHHLVYRSQGGAHDPENLVVLCWKCHELVHLGVLSITLVEVAPGEWRAFRRVRRL